MNENLKEKLLARLEALGSDNNFLTNVSAILETDDEYLEVWKFTEQNKDLDDIEQKVIEIFERQV